MTEILKLIPPISVACIVFAQGLGIAPSQVLGLFRDRPWLLLRILVAVLVLVPAATLVILLVLRPDPALAIGLAILVSCPPAPLMVANAPKKGASAPFMARLHLAFSAFAILTVPAVLHVLSGPLGFKPEIDLGAMLWTLTRTNLLPLALGLAVRGLAPAAADRLGPTLHKAGMIGIVLVVLLVLAKFYPTLLGMPAWSYLTIALVSGTALAIGYFAGPEDSSEKTGLAVECGVRHPGLATAIASATLTSARALPLMIPCALSFMVIATVYLSLRQKTLSKDPPGVTSGKPS